MRSFLDSVRWNITRILQHIIINIIILSQVKQRDVVKEWAAVIVKVRAVSGDKEKEARPRSD